MPPTRGHRGTGPPRHGHSGGAPRLTKPRPLCRRRRSRTVLQSVLVGSAEECGLCRYRSTTLPPEIRRDRSGVVLPTDTVPGSGQTGETPDRNGPTLLSERVPGSHRPRDRTPKSLNGLRTGASLGPVDPPARRNFTGERSDETWRGPCPTPVSPSGRTPTPSLSTLRSSASTRRGAPSPPTSLHTSKPQVGSRLCRNFGTNRPRGEARPELGTDWYRHGG